MVAYHKAEARFQSFLRLVNGRQKMGDNGSEVPNENVEESLVTQLQC